jgi:formylglycine-generating enzyme required for sulfatase activity
MHYAPNRFGLYDLAGNVNEWCEDWSDERKMDRVLRGSNYFHAERASMLSSVRNDSQPHRYFTAGGFRCVRVREEGTARPAP